MVGPHSRQTQSHAGRQAADRDTHMDVLRDTQRSSHRHIHMGKHACSAMRTTAVTIIVTHTREHAHIIRTHRCTYMHAPTGIYICRDAHKHLDSPTDTPRCVPQHMSRWQGLPLTSSFANSETLPGRPIEMGSALGR